MAQILFGFFSEDARVERTGQITAVGMWGGTLTLAGTPHTLRSIAFNAYVENPELRPYRFSIRIEGPLGLGPTLPLVHEGQMQVDSQRSSHFLGLIMGPALVLQPGAIRATLRIESEPPIEKVFTLEVRHGPVGAPELAAAG
jgi:hypothetical protein